VTSDGDLAAFKIRWVHWVPGLRTLRQYQFDWLIHDVVAGVVLATMLVPVGIAYAVASGVPGVYGLYATIVPLAPVAFWFWDQTRRWPL
jgi:MFS superfamily sulfate permease-like transporter